MMKYLFVLSAVATTSLAETLRTSNFTEAILDDDPWRFTI